MYETGVCKHCAYPIRRVTGAVTSTLRAWADQTGERGCRPGLFYVDRKRWLANPPELRGKAATLDRTVRMPV